MLTVLYNTVQTVQTVQSVQTMLTTDIAVTASPSPSNLALVVAGGADPGVAAHQGHPQQARRLHRLLASRLHLRQVECSTLVSRYVSLPVIMSDKTCHNICMPGVPAS